MESPEWSEIRATYRHARHPEMWNVSILLMLQERGRFISDEAYRCGIIARLYRDFWGLNAEDPHPASEMCATSFETSEEWYLPDKLVEFLMQIPENAEKLRCLSMVQNTAADEGIEFAQRILIQLRNPQTAHLSEPFDRFPAESVRHFLALNRVKRTGWTRAIPEFAPGCETAELVETVAEHSIKAAFWGVCANPDDLCNSFIMGICHDQAEIVVGDIPPQQAPSREIKHQMELEAYGKLIADLGDATNARALMQYFEQYMHVQTPTAHIMHIADKLDMALQALTYEERYHINLEEFIVSATSDICQSWSRWLHSDK